MKDRKLKRSHRTTRICLARLYVFAVVPQVILNQIVSTNCFKVGLKRVCKIKKSKVNLLEQVNSNLNDDFCELNNMDSIYLLDLVDCNFIKPFNI